MDLKTTCFASLFDMLYVLAQVLTKLNIPFLLTAFLLSVEYPKFVSPLFINSNNSSRLVFTSSSITCGLIYKLSKS